MANYLGNNDYRGYLSYRASQGDNLAGDALAFVGNDGGINESQFSTYGFDTPHKNPDQLRNYISSSFGEYNGQSQGTTEGFSTGGSYSGTGSTYNPQQAALFDQAISNAESGINRLGTQEQVGLTNVSDSYNSALNRLLQGKAVTDRDYNTNKLQTTEENVKAKSNIDFNTGRQANSLQRLLGSKGAGRSTAATVAAPYAAALQGTQQRREVSDSFGKNMQALDTSYGDFNRNYDLTVQDAGAQKERSERELRSGILDKRNNLLSTIAQLRSQKASLLGGNAAASAQPYLDQINQNNAQIDQLGNQFTNRVNVQNPTYKAPELEQYTVERPQAAQFGGGSALTGSINPSYLSLLMGGKRKQELSY